MSEHGWLQDDPPAIPEAPPSRPLYREPPITFVGLDVPLEEAVYDVVGEHHFAVGQDFCRDCGLTMAEADVARACR